MKIQRTRLNGVLLLEPEMYSDDRGFFSETYRREAFPAELDFVQDNLSRSRQGVIRGLHYQIEHPQAKLVMAVSGEILDVAVDLREGSTTFGLHSAHRLSGTNMHQLYIPEGFAHGFSVLSESAVVYYKCSDYYFPQGERGIRWDDPDLAIDWQVDDPVLSEKDRGLPTLNEITFKDLF